VKSYWNGSESIAKSFWLLYILGSVAIAISTSLLILLAGVVIDFPTYTFAFLIFLLLLLLNPFYVFCWVAVWRSSNKVKSIFINLGVKAIVVIHVMYFGYNLTLIPELLSIVT
jgi:hypothetical protein